MISFDKTWAFPITFSFWGISSGIREYQLPTYTNTCNLVRLDMMSLMDREKTKYNGTKYVNSWLNKMTAIEVCKASQIWVAHCHNCAPRFLRLIETLTKRLLVIIRLKCTETFYDYFIQFIKSLEYFLNYFEIGWKNTYFKIL